MLGVTCSPGREPTTHQIYHYFQHLIEALLFRHISPCVYARVFKRFECACQHAPRIMGMASAMRLCAIVTIVTLVCFGGAFAALCDGKGQQHTEALPGVLVNVDGNVIGLSTSAETVGNLVDILQIELDPLDRTNPSPGTKITDGMAIVVTRVECRETMREEAIPASTVVLADPDRPAGFTKILRHGEDGRVQRKWRIWKKDGEETSRAVVSEEILTEMSSNVVLRGTDGLPDRGGDWRRPLVMEATAYEPGPRSCGKWANGYTATGVKAEKGVVAVDDGVIPMGTRLYIPGYGFALAADRGSAIKGMRIDLCYPTYEEAIQFGRRDIRVYILD